METKIGNNLRKLRFEHNEISQDELAKAVGVSRQTIISIEKGKYSPSVGLAIKLAHFLKVSVEDIFFLEGAD